MSKSKFGVLKLAQQSNVVEVLGNNYYFACDVSGSMYGSLQAMREQLKNRLPQILGPDDTISIIWFSGKGEAGFISKLVNVKNVTQLDGLQKAIDRYLKTVGLTDFVSPLQLVKDLVVETKKLNSNPISLIFLSDGWHNDSPWSGVENVLEGMETLVDAATIIEYGYYADSAKLSQMADSLGGTKIFSEDFDSYSLSIENVLQSHSAPRIEVDIESIKSDLLYQFLFTVSGGKITTYSAARAKSVHVPEGTDAIYYINKTGEVVYSAETHSSYLASIYLLLEKYKVDEVEKLIYKLGYLPLTSKYELSYGKGAVEELKELVLELLNGEVLTNLDPANRPSPTAFCVVDLMNTLTDGENYVLPTNKKFNYSRTGVKRVSKTAVTSHDKEQFADLKTMSAQQESIAESGFTAHKDVLVPISSLTLNSERANISMLFKIPGSYKLPKNSFGKDSVETFIFRNYTIIKDGILNMNTLPVVLDSETYDVLSKVANITLTALDGIENGYLIDFSGLPIINRSMVSAIKFEEVASLERDLLLNSADVKYLKTRLKLEKDEPMAQQESAEFVAYLKELGITSYGGYSPKTEKGVVTDFYFTNSLITKIEKFSSLPAIDKVLEKKASGKSLTASEALIDSAVVKYEKTPLSELLDVLTEKTATQKALIREIATNKFSLILSKRWFLGREIDDNTSVVDINGADYTLTIDWKEERVEI